MDEPSRSFNREIDQLRAELCRENSANAVFVRLRERIGNELGDAIGGGEWWRAGEEIEKVRDILDRLEELVAERLPMDDGG